MISRYTTPQMAELFSDEQKYHTWRQVERAAMRHHPDVPDEAVKTLDILSQPTPQDVAYWETKSGHDVVAFLDALRYRFAHLKDIPDYGRWLHHGLTSSDVVDTALAIHVNRGISLLYDAGVAWDETLYRVQLDRVGLVRLGRTHGQAAAPTTFSHQLAYHRDGVDRSINRLIKLQLPGKLSGPVGYPGPGTLTKDQEWDALQSLGLHRNRANSQIVMRDQLARVVCELAVLAGVIEGFATMVRLGAQTAVGELMEGQAEDRVGSSAMSHKRNPIISEQLCGLAAYVRGLVGPVLGNIALWDERDISHSSVERIIIPDIFNVVHYMLLTVTQLTAHLVVDEDRIRRNLDEAVGAGSFAGTQWLVRHGESREEAREIAKDWVWSALDDEEDGDV